MHPVLFHLHTPFGLAPVYAYGTMLGVAILAGWYAMRAAGARFGLDADVTGNAYALSVFGALVGGRVAFALANHSMLRAPASLVSPAHGGLAVAGGLLLGGLGLFAMARRHRVPFLRLLDVTTPAVALGVFLTRIGCYLYGCDYGVRLGHGAPRWLARLGTFPRWEDAHGVYGSPVFMHQLTSGDSGLSIEAKYGLPVHPTQLYESLLGLTLLALSIFLVRRAPRAGDVFFPCSIAYAAGRLLVEPLRADPERGFVGPVSVPQIASVALLVAIAIAIAIRHRSTPITPTEA